MANEAGAAVLHGPDGAISAPPLIWGALIRGARSRHEWWERRFEALASGSSQ